MSRWRACDPRPSSWRAASTSQRSQLRKAKLPVWLDPGKEVWRRTPQCSSFIGKSPIAWAAFGFRVGSGFVRSGDREAQEQLWGHLKEEKRSIGGKQDAVPAWFVPHASRVQAEIRGLVVPKITPNKHERSREDRQKQDGRHTSSAPSLLRWSSFQKVAGCAACEARTLEIGLRQG